MAAEIEVRDEAHFRYIRLLRADKKNALTIAMYEAMSAALRDAASDPTIYGVCVEGDGGVFSAGNDLNDFVANPPTGPDSPVMQFLAVIAGFDKPLFAAVHGAAVGIGTTFLLHCDMVWAAPNARFQLPFVRLGLVPEAGSSLLLPALVGHVRAFEYLVLGRAFGADEASRLGLVNAVVEDPSTVMRENAREVAKLAPDAVIATKRLMREARGSQVHDTIAREGEVFLSRLKSEAFAAAVAGFLGARKP